MRGRLVCALMAGAALTMASCSSKHTGSVVGKWAKGNDTIVTFTVDGKMIDQEGARTTEMQYSIEDGTNLFLKSADAPISMHFTIFFSSDNEMVITPLPPKDAPAPPQSLESVQFTRVKE